MINILGSLREGESLEIDRLRIWDFYVLFPDKIYDLGLKQNEKEIRDFRRSVIVKSKNPYNQVYDSKKIFNRMRQVQLMAFNCLASYGIINKEDLKANRITLEDENILAKYIENVTPLNFEESNVIRFLVKYFKKMSMFGTDGLKSRSKLLESKYDA
jgi:hypothetical protein